jgi:O-antigen/teichoic acid export membrane protein
LSFFVSLRIDQMLLVGIVATEELGVYAVAAAFSTLSGPIARGVAQGVLPFVRNASSDDERLARIKQSLQWVSVASAVTLLAIAVSAQWFLPFIFNDKFEGAVRPLLLLLPGAFATDVTQVYTTALSSFNRPQDASKAQIASAIATAIGLLILIRPYGIDGAAITTSIAYWVALVVSVFYWRRLRRRVLRGEATGETSALEDVSV